MATPPNWGDATPFQSGTASTQMTAAQQQLLQKQQQQAYLMSLLGLSSQ